MSDSLARLGLALEGLKVDRSKMFLNFSQDSQVACKVKPPSPHQHDHCSHNIVHMLQKSSSTLNIGDELYEYSAEDLYDIGELGRGSFGTVNKMLHKESNTEMAVKRIRAAIDEREQQLMLKELNIVMNSSDCQFIVEFYGAIFNEGDCWICMELMTTSVDKAYKAVHKILNQRIPEEILAKIAYCVIKALHYLKTNLNIIHRDVKPSNMLLDVHGRIKLCDFGISGQLVDSIARTRDAGCQPYMAKNWKVQFVVIDETDISVICYMKNKTTKVLPERIDPMHARSGYDVTSDVWSLGLSLIEISRGKFPYPMWQTVFDQLNQVVRGDPPQLMNTNEQIYSQDCLHCVNSCMIKDCNKRPKYPELLSHPFLKAYTKDNNVKTWFQDLIRQVPNIAALNIETEAS